MNKLSIKKNIQTLINWEDIIILPGFYNILDINNLKEVSLISQLTRIKLKPKLFTNIKFNGINFDKYFNNSKKNLIWGYLDYKRYNLELEYGVVNGINEYKIVYGEKKLKDDESFDEEEYVDYDYFHFKNFEVEPGLRDLKEQLSEHSKLAKSFHLTEVYNAGYYIFPLLNMFESLNTIKICFCTIPFNGLLKIFNSLTNLESIELEYVSLEELSTTKFTLGDVQFPKALKTLSFIECNLYSNRSLINPYEFLFQSPRYTDGIREQDFILPATSIPSLLNFKFITEYYDEHGTNQFLENNPQLKSLKINSYILDQFKLNYFEKSQSLKNLELYVGYDVIDIEIPALSSIEELTFDNFNPVYHSSAKNFCLSSENLKKLNIILYTSTQIIENLDYAIDNIISKCARLKEFSICTDCKFKEVLDLSKLANVETLTIESELTTICNIEFSNSITLKYVNFYYKGTKLELKNIKKKFYKINNNWKFKYYEGYIKGVKV